MSISIIKADKIFNDIHQATKALSLIFAIASIAHSFDCPSLNLSKLYNESDLIVDGRIVNVSDSSFSFLATKHYKANSDTNTMIEVMKRCEPLKGNCNYNIPHRWKMYEVDENLILFLNMNSKHSIYWSMGCFFEGEVVRFGDSLSFSQIRINADTHCPGCRVFHVDSLSSEINRDKISDSLISIQSNSKSFSIKNTFGNLFLGLIVGASMIIASLIAK